MPSIQPVNAEIYPEVVALLEKSNLPTKDLSETTSLFVMQNDSTIIGTIGVEFYGQAALLRSLAVAEEYRSTGLGKELVYFLESYTKDKGVEELYLLTTTAEAFFSRRGYQAIERTTVPEEIKKSSEFSSVCPSSATVMKRKVTG